MSDGVQITEGTCLAESKGLSRSKRYLTLGWEWDRVPRGNFGTWLSWLLASEMWYGDSEVARIPPLTDGRVVMILGFFTVIKLSRGIRTAK